MADIKPSSHGIVVEHKESGVRYALSDVNYNPKVHRKVRDLHPGETILGYKPKSAGSLAGDSEQQASGAGSTDPAGDAAGELATGAPTQETGSPKTEGSAPAGTKGK